jgi:ClpP class serine protease
MFFIGKSWFRDCPARALVETRSKIAGTLQGVTLASRRLSDKPSTLMFRTIIKARFSVQAANEPASLPKAKKVSVIVIPVRDEIAEPVHYILRRGLKEQVDVVVLDMDTLGGNAQTALDIMGDLTKFQGATITFVNDKAVSAGAFIALRHSERLELQLPFRETGKISQKQ